MIFSIIIPTLNVQQQIESALNSISVQTYQDYEIIVIDGGSTDDTIEILKQTNDNRLKVFSLKGSGIYEAMNFGISKAKGEWLYFMGSDDQLYEKDTLNEIKKATIRNNNYDLLYGNVMSKLFYDGTTPYDGFFDLKKLSKKNICHQAIFYNKKIFDIISPYNTQFKILADYDFNIRCFGNKDVKTKYLPMIIAKYGSEGVSSKKKDYLFELEKNFICLKNWTDISFLLKLELLVKGIINKMKFYATI